jgi:hypothetical protein
MHLLLGGQHDECLIALSEKIRGDGSEVEILAGAFAQSARLSWAFDSSRSRTRLALADGRCLNADDIEGVVVRRSGGVERVGWSGEDYSFVEAEHQAALIGWLWSLRCPVVNRLPAAVWFHDRLPLVFWKPALRQSGLSLIDCLLSNIEDDLRAFGRQHAGAVYTPLTGDGHYELRDDNSWEQLADIHGRFPLYVTAPNTEVRFACVVGQEIIWATATWAGARNLEPALLQFAAVVGLSFFEIGVIQTTDGPCVTAVNPEPSLARYPVESRAKIIDSLADLLSGRVPAYDRFPSDAELPWQTTRPT